ncbi:TonB-dependent receptor plug domain-containing protein [Prolixibacteraceae bacterium Z1-6]|uniref:TonB-dependent receptor plug domain-containing protein n=1 Tax=Draconibacterium aestuarii TaxID=2998507 RepID=A0A9X3J834_9BACT|nr:TonB-dependent receptor plug domain-containing protein [Prolixibacteraceae bacterium Z1-6]
MMKLKIDFKSVLFFVLFLSVSFISAQEKTLVGKITTFDSIPLIGVNIQVKSTGESVQTDTLGRFQTFCNPKDRILVEADGFFPKRVKIEEHIRMILVNLDLKRGETNLDRAERYVNVGYGYSNSKDLLYAVSHANNNDIDFANYDNILDAIQGQFPGVSVQNGTIIIRGASTFYGSQGDAALVVIDGAITNYNDLINMSPHDVQSIDVLKDGSSSVYGSRGANGVVIITTKKGRK